MTKHCRIFQFDLHSKRHHFSTPAGRVVDTVVNTVCVPSWRPAPALDGSCRWGHQCVSPAPVGQRKHSHEGRLQRIRPSQNPSIQHVFIHLSAVIALQVYAAAASHAREHS